MIYHSPIGNIRIHIRDGKLLNVDFSVEDADGQSIPDDELSQSTLRQTIEWLDTYFDGHIPSFLPPLSPQGTLFQKRVWNALLNIPYGTTTSYADIAKSVGCKSAQAVGQAIGKNPICIIIPCHRVIGRNGHLTGYAWGLQIKNKLVETEKSFL